MNRFFRRLRSFGKQPPQQPTQGPDEGSGSTAQEVPSTRAKSDRHKKSTADRWNQ